jgi:hypothetical protein
VIHRLTVDTIGMYCKKQARDQTYTPQAFGADACSTESFKR